MSLWSLLIIEECVLYTLVTQSILLLQTHKTSGSGILLVERRLSSLPIIHCVGYSCTGIRVDTIYFDESHNSVKSNFHDALKYFADVVAWLLFFTASPKYSYVDDTAGMNDRDVYGDIIYTTPVTEMIDGGYIVSTISQGD